MRVLGIASDVWISSAALIEDGKIVHAVAEERYNRRKMAKDFPRASIDSCLARAGIGINDVDAVAFGWSPAGHMRQVSGRFLDTMRWRGEYLYMVPASLVRQFGSPNITNLTQHVETEDWDCNIVYVNHHMAHAASAYNLSPFEDCAIFTMDGRGDADTCTWNVGRNGTIEKVKSLAMPTSIGLLYSSITDFLGFKPHVDEWKVMALASYGKKTDYVDRLRRLITLLDDGGFEIDLSYFSFYKFDPDPYMFSEKFIELFGEPRTSDEELTSRHQDIAFAMQAVFEEIATHMLVKLHDLTGMDRLAMAGGAVMNSVYNGKILDRTPFKELFIPSCPDDSGVSLGAALYAYQQMAPGSPIIHHRDNYWGDEFSDAEIEETLAKYKLNARKCETPADTAAEMLENGKLVGWFQGRMEFGQRALGNRSILADPRREDSKDLVNKAVKYRESFRPFAPAILSERLGDYFHAPEGLEVLFMERVLDAREEKKAEIPAVVHVDGTGRVQSVDKGTNPLFYQLIEAFEARTGVPIVLNTSFNLNGEPIVRSPSDAIRSFFTCGLDALFLGSYLIEKPKT